MAAGNVLWVLWLYHTFPVDPLASLALVVPRTEEEWAAPLTEGEWGPPKAVAALLALVALVALMALRTWEALAGPLGLGPLVAMAHLSMPGTAQATAAAGPLADLAFRLHASWLLAAAEVAQTETALAVSPTSAALHPLAEAAQEPPP